MIYFALFIAFVIFQRIIELLVANKNERWARSRGAIEYGQNHYPFIVALHTLFIISLMVEYYFREEEFNLSLMIVFLLLILAKIWVIASLGRYWNTKILRIPEGRPVKKGAYRIFRHPNYFIVVCEIIVIPMVYNLYITAIVFTILNAIALTVRIKEEDRVWQL